jgi:myo-inositol catabolism protein IolS
MGGLSFVEGLASGWADVDENEITAAVKKAVDAGVNHFDNADVYGNGRAEQMLRRVLKRLGLKTEDFVIATKIGHHRGTAEYAYDPLHIRHQCEQSLKNLGREYLDIYYFHHGDFGPNGEHLHEAVAAMDALVAEGKVRLKGQSAYNAAHFVVSVPVLKPTVLQSWANALDPQFIKLGSPVANLMAAHKMSFVAFSPLKQGLLLDKFNPDKPPQFEDGDNRKGKEVFGAENLRELRKKLVRIKERFGSEIEDLSAVAQRYVLNHPNVACVIPGFRNERQVACNLAAAERSLSTDDSEFIEEVLQR